jgi:FAD/FMN-containing dehydrogenase
MAGGYIQGGGHSLLSSVYGLAADQALSFEVITTEGKFLVASPTQNRDLYWALSGGVSIELLRTEFTLNFRRAVELTGSYGP